MSKFYPLVPLNEVLWFLRTYRAKLLIKVYKFALKSRLTGVHNLIFSNLTKNTENNGYYRISARVSS